MNTFLHNKFKFNLRQHVQSGDRILVALSSGQDSLCLLQLLVDCLDGKKCTIHAVYIDHQWKNSSKKHVRHIANIMKFRKLAIAIYQIKQSLFSENKARKIRYKIMILHALKEKYDTIIAGHNANDKIETAISNLFRGTSINGISNLTVYKKVKQQLAIMRPLINFTKTEIAWLCRLFYLPIWSDETNYNLNLKRNRIRHELIPYIQNFFNPSIQNSLLNFIYLCQQDNEYIKESTVKLYIKSRHMKFISLNLEVLDKQHKALQKRVFRLYFYYCFHQQIDNKIAKWILDYNEKKENTTFYFNNIVLQRCDRWIYAIPYIVLR